MSQNISTTVPDTHTDVLELLGFLSSIFVVLGVSALIVFFLVKAEKKNKEYANKSTSTPNPVASSEPIIVSNEIMNAAFPDRSAGRECTICNQHGTHHTDNHNAYATVALDQNN